jgi:hypothetical protein
MPYPDTDAGLAPLFKTMAQEDTAKSAKEGRPIYDDVEVVEVRRAGSRDYGVYPANQMAGWITDPYSGEQRTITYAEKFQRQYRQFKEHQQQTKSGTPLDFAAWLTESRRMELKSMNVYTVEALASIDGSELKNLGPGGREIKNKAEEYIINSKNNAPNLEAQAKLEALEARAQLLEEDNAMLKYKINSGEARFEAMSIEQLRDYITSNTGHSPIGALNKKALIRHALEIPQPKAG